MFIRKKLKNRGLDYLRPEPNARNKINRIIMDELVMGLFKPESTAYFQ
jgi:aspartate racemase